MENSALINSRDWDLAVGSHSKVRDNHALNTPPQFFLFLNSLVRADSSDKIKLVLKCVLV